MPRKSSSRREPEPSDIPEVLPADMAPPEERPPVVSKAPPTDRKFPCGKCGAKLNFDPSQQALKCPYCGHVEEIAAPSKPVSEQDYEEYLNKVAGEETTIAGRSSQVQCAACGAVVLLEDKLVTDKCPFCGTHLENKPETAEAMIAPEGILPFLITNRDARDAFKKWLEGRWFAPTTLKLFANLGELNGIYLPFWTYDSMTFSSYSGMRGDNYTVSETYTERDAQGNMVTKTRMVTKIRWTPVSGRVDHFFDDVLVFASHSVPEDLVNNLATWDLEKLEEFKPDFLSGFKTERYAIGLEEGFANARTIMDGEIRRLCCRDIGGDHQQLSTVHTRHVGVTFKHILLPLWLANYRYHNDLYRIAVNGRTGDVVGTRPYSWVKIALLVVAIIAVIALVILVVMAFSGTAHGKEVGQAPELQSVGFQSVGVTITATRPTCDPPIPASTVPSAVPATATIARACSPRASPDETLPASIAG